MGEVDLAPLPGLGADRHVLDEAHLQAVLARETGQRHDVAVRDAADGDRVDLDRSEAGPLGGLDAVQDPVQPVAAGHLAEALRVQRVEADVDAPQAGVDRAPAPARPARCRWSSGRCRGCRADGTSIATSWARFAAHQRLAAGQADLVDPQGHRHADEVGDLLEGEQLGPVHEDDLFGHAVGAAQVAAVGHADAQVVVHATEGVD